MWKKTLSALQVLVMLFLLSGCWDYVEIDQQISVSGIGFDIGKMGKRFHVCVEVVTVSPEGRNSLEVNLLETDADTIREAMQDLETMASKKIYFGHCRMMVIGCDLAKYGISELLDIPGRSYELRTTMGVVLSSNCTAKEIFQTKGIASPIIAYKIHDLIENSEHLIGTMSVKKEFEVYNEIKREGLCPIIPALEICQQSDKDVVKLCGGGVFEGDRLVAFLNDLQLKNLSLMRNEIKRASLTISEMDAPNKQMSLNIYKNTTQTALSFDGDEISAVYVIKSTIQIAEVQKKTDYSKPEEIEKLKGHIQRAIEKDMNLLVQTAQDDLKRDIFGIGDMLYREYPKQWTQYRENWPDQFPKVKIKVISQVSIISSGATKSAL